MNSPRTLYQKHIDSHTVATLDDQGHVLLYIDRQVANEYTSPQAFSGLREAKRGVWRPRATLAVVDHVNPTSANRIAAMPDADGALQVSYFEENCRDFGIELLDLLDKRQGIEHVVAPEQGFILPGMVVAAGDSHTTTYGALGALGFGIGTSEIEHLLATQTLVYKRLKTMRVTVTGKLGMGVTAKDIIMALIEKIGASGATGYAIEFAGPVINALSVEARMTICNMAVEAGARGAFMAPDEKVFAYVKSKPRAPQGEYWKVAERKWRELFTDEGAVFDREILLDVDALEPMVTWGTSPDQASFVGGSVPDPTSVDDPILRQSMQRALTYMGLEAGMALSDVQISHAFIGSCTNARIEDLRDVARVVKGRKVASTVRAMIVPGSTLVRAQAEEEGLARIFLDAGFEWRQSGCSMCLAMNDDVLAPGDRCASSTNRNFEGRQGAGARTHLMSPAMVAAAAIRGRLTDVRLLAEEA
ncbi:MULTISPECIES: 3-isopropylmalate dehydratase large subunit [unclassified Pseudomonas]|uniref:3-isopropylmalate dehydratase large subunit n=1 Tax=unclassified Pseudomonas TaxID=196821 RepID=UPI0008764F5A|nr:MULTISPECIES: 3-isopropylmalate dehydratase large subunit [unclassified Pseudomonas]SCZ39809.1 3-isopropylmalate/(R)-2-methylmalate dehydratase large subunit [Pseudomonas sp. NFACC44-2]SDA89665.1 3-isopropylmalate/(R)-2-methylmalate dehydratase large subunit [Pseudomonas sp. NFACC51]SDW44235.1 3-isopropylmalate/(R)-2-methylmalate dehydratase large subunit [Pseudomonas sp. NFACC08-1]SFI15189.1 3-isopropylmalate/(R)-2-methylmalate dehydratase large subunit [Pseudomonas sp. NFACC54]SFT28278.1 